MGLFDKFKKILLITLVVLIAIIITLGVTIRIANNSIAKGLEKELLACEHPTEIEIIESISVAGKMMGNGNGMQWFGIILVKSGMDENMLSDWYKSHVTTEDNETVFVLKQKSDSVFDYKAPYFKNYPGGNDIYKVCLLRNLAVGAESTIWESLLNWDLRGH